MPILAGSGGPSTPNHKWFPKERKALPEGKGVWGPTPWTDKDCSQVTGVLIYTKDHAVSML